MSAGRGETSNFTLACLEDPLEDSDIVLLKLLSPEWSSDPKIRERFLTRYRAGAALQDPGFPAILAVGQDESSNTVFAAIEQFDGWSLHELMRRATSKDLRPAPELLLGLGIEFAQLLGRLHAADVDPPLCHGSLGPHELFVLRDGSVRVLTFGSAVELDPFGRCAPHRYAYAAPEQLREEATSPRSDIYSLALILYSAIQGENPYERLDGSDTMLAALTEELVLEAPYDQLFSEALSEHPDERPAQMQDFAETLRRSLGERIEGEALALRLEWLDDLTQT